MSTLQKYINGTRDISIPQIVRGLWSILLRNCKQQLLLFTVNVEQNRPTYHQGQQTQYKAFNQCWFIYYLIYVKPTSIQRLASAGYISEIHSILCISSNINGIGSKNLWRMSKTLCASIIWLCVIYITDVNQPTITYKIEGGLGDSFADAGIPL